MRIFLPETLSGDRQRTVIEIVEALAATPGVAAVVLGGSYARGAARPDSDVDLGIYYDPATPFRIDDIVQIARRYFMTDKGALQMIEGFALRPANYGREIGAILAAPGSDVTALTQSVARLETLWQRIVELTNGAYRPKFEV